MMELDFELARFVISSCEDLKYSERMLQRAREIIKTGFLLSIHTFIVHRQYYLEFSSCTGVVLLEEWSIEIVPRKSINIKVNF